MMMNFFFSSGLLRTEAQRLFETILQFTVSPAFESRMVVGPVLVPHQTGIGQLWVNWESLNVMSGQNLIVIVTLMQVTDLLLYLDLDTLSCWWIL